MESASLPRALQRHQTTAWVTFVFIATMTLLGAFLPQERYEATSIVAVQPANEGVTTGLLDFLIPSLEAKVRGSALAAAVDRTLPLPVRNANREVSTFVSARSGVMSINVVSDTRQASVTLANTYARFLATRNLGTPALRVLVIDSATGARQTTSRSTLILSGLGLGVILAPLVALGREWLGLDEDDEEDMSWDVPGRAPGDTPARSALAGRPALTQLDPAPQAYRVH
jgi:hypothetical protein